MCKNTQNARHIFASRTSTVTSTERRVGALPIQRSAVRVRLVTRQSRGWPVSAPTACTVVLVALRHRSIAPTDRSHTRVGPIGTMSETRHLKAFCAGIVQIWTHSECQNPPRITCELLVCSARGGDRTRTHFRGGGFKPPVSANSTTRAGAASQAIRSGGAPTPHAPADLGAMELDDPAANDRDWRPDRFGQAKQARCRAPRCDLT